MTCKYAGITGQQRRKCGVTGAGDSWLADGGDAFDFNVNGNVNLAGFGRFAALLEGP